MDPTAQSFSERNLPFSRFIHAEIAREDVRGGIETLSRFETLSKP
jgi:hypothetical protein